MAENSRKLPPISPRPLPSPSKPKKKKKTTDKSDGEFNNSYTKSPDSDLSPDCSQQFSNTEEKVLEKNETSAKKSHRVLPPIRTSLSSENLTKELQTPEKRKKKKKSAPTAASTENELDETQTNRTPKKKKKKKKLPSTNDEEELAEEYLNTLLYDLGNLEEDVITSSVPPGEDFPISLGPLPVIHSQPADVLYIETNRKFKATPKSKAIMHSTEPIPVKEDQFHSGGSLPQQTTLEFAISTYQVWKSLCLFVHGLTAGIGLWHISMVAILNQKGDLEFLEFYGRLALSIQSIFYTLLVICTVSVCDRYDISNLTRSFLLRSLTLQTGAISVIIYFICLILSVSIANIDDKMFLHNNNTRLFQTPKELEEDLSVWRVINILRGVGVILGWLVLSITPNTDRLSESLAQDTDDVFGIIISDEGKMKA